MTKKEAEDLIYRSYLKANKHLDRNVKDAYKRHPEITHDLLHDFSDEASSVAITGSKGKGSVANMISLILQNKFKVGLMTSLHIISFCERFKINNEDISEEDFINLIQAIKPKIDAIEATLPQDVAISPMGIESYAALKYFKENNTDFNVFECGKGARFDDVNNIKHDYSVINPIFLEHTRELGDTVADIAFDKAHIITGEQKCVYVASQPSEEALRIIKDRASKFGTKLKLYGEDFKAENIRYTRRGMLFDVRLDGGVGVEFKDIFVPLLGAYQAENCALAMALCLDVLGELTEKEVNESMKRLDWPGRMEILSDEPFILLDACINKVDAEEVVKVLKELKIDKVNTVIGIPDDKDYLGVALVMSGISDKLIMTRSDNPHYVFTPKDATAKVTSALEGLEPKKTNCKITWAESFVEAISNARKLQKDKPLIILGTTSLISEAKRIAL